MISDSNPKPDEQALCSDYEALRRRLQARNHVQHTAFSRLRTMTMLLAVVSCTVLMSAFLKLPSFTTMLLSVWLGGYVFTLYAASKVRPRLTTPQVRTGVALTALMLLASGFLWALVT